MKTVDVIIKKPMYGTKVYIREVYIRQAIDQNKLLKITIPQGTAIHDPREWKKTGDRMEKVFNFPDKPMVLWGNYVNIELITSKEEKQAETLF